VHGAVTRTVLAVAALGVGGCQSLEDTAPAPELDYDAFLCVAEPVLATRCAFYGCHGTPLRPLRLYAPNRLRLNPTRLPGDYVLSSVLSPEEHRANYDMARGFADAARAEDSLLLLKPLDVEAGGALHGGKTLYGGADVFSTEDDPGYVLLRGWLEGNIAPRGCTPVDAVGR
jgi:hypothetical protein